MQKNNNVFSITAIAILSASLFGSVYANAESAASYFQNIPPSDDLITYWKEANQNWIDQKYKPVDKEMKDSIIMMGGLVPTFPSAFAQIPVDKISEYEAEGRAVVELNLVAQSVDLPIMGGKTYMAMTFSGQVPGPTVRVTQGDIIKMTLTVPDDEPTPHSNDMHASQMSAVPSFGAVMPGESKTYAYIAEVPGTFKYHCAGINVAAMDQHVLSGMYGMAIVDPLNGYKPLLVEKTKTEDGKVQKDRKTYSPDALEFQLQYNQLYLTEDGAYDQSAMFQHKQAQHVVNGMAFGYTPNADINKLVTGDPKKNLFVAQPWNSADLNQYQGKPLFVPVEEHIRFFVENSGNEPVYWHIVGEIIDRVTQGNVVQAKGTETWLVGGSQGAIMDVVFDKPGVYVAVNHDYAAIFGGAATVMVAGDFFELGIDGKSYADVLGNPSDAIPPSGKNTISHPKINLHGLYTDERAQEISTELGI
ncbi:MAG: multicopper oxidase domain-containing protein [Candidatus Nitrosotenuis sp.]